MNDDDAKDEAGELLLDPFSFMPDAKSRIAGLGGTQQALNPNYVFHTSYVRAAPGRCHFGIRFDRLTAKSGTLQLLVHIISDEAGSAALVANSERIALNRLVQIGGAHAIRFESFVGYSFALMGVIYGDTDAAADGLAVVLDRPAGADDRAVSGDGRATAFGEATRDVALLLSTAPPSFAAPVTQLCTGAQLREPDFIALRSRLGRRDGDDLPAWQEAFVLQVLRRYGMLAAGARGIAFGVRDGRLPALIAQAEVRLDLVPPPDDAADCGDDTDPLFGLDPFPEHLVDYDFAFSTGILGRVPVAAGIRFVETCTACLRPGGLMVHAAPFDLSTRAPRASAGATLFSRAEVERAALIALSRNHDVAQYKIDDSDAVRDPDQPGAVGAFGMIVRRGGSIL